VFQTKELLRDFACVCFRALVDKKNPIPITAPMPADLMKS
jgi:hypothetical protein